MIEIAITSSSGSSAQLADQLGEHVGGAGERQEFREQHRADADEEQLRGRSDGVLERVDEARDSVSWRCTTPISIASSAPTAPPSVGVTMPA